MKLFLDTSSLVKLYHREADTSVLEHVFITQNITAIFLSDITKIEFASTVFKKVRTSEITREQAFATLQLFEADFEKYYFIATDSIIIEQAKRLIEKYGLKGLRTLDSIQLSTAISLSKQVDIFLTADKLLQSLFVAEGLSIDIPNI